MLVITERLAPRRAFTLAVGALAMLGCSAFHGRGNPTPSRDQGAADADAGMTFSGVVDVAVGERFTCAVDEAGGVWCFGDGAHGQLGDQMLVEQRWPVRVPSVDGAVTVTAGAEHVCALLAGGTVWCWGRNDWGQLGHGHASERGAPAPVLGLAGATRLEAGPRTTCAIVDGGLVRCWGRRPSATGPAVATEPQTVEGIAGATALSVGDEHGCALRDGEVSCWGLDAGELSASDARDVSADSWSEDLFVPVVRTCWLRPNGDLECRRPDHRPPPMSSSWIPGAVEILDGPAPSSAQTRSGNGSAGAWCGLTEDRRVVCPGLADWDGRTVDGVRAADGGAVQGCAVRDSGELVCWGRNDSGQLGIGVPAARERPVDVLGVTDAVALAAGFMHTCAVHRSGEVTCWGASRTGELGRAPTQGHPYARFDDPGPFVGVTDAVDVFVREGLTCVVRRGGEVRCAGDARDEWAEVLATDRAVEGAVGLYLLCLRDAAGDLACGASNGVFQPEWVAELEAWVGARRGVERLTATQQHVCALEGGAVECFGLGGASTLARDATFLASGGRSVCVVRGDGSVACGQPGGELVPLAGVSDATAVSVSHLHPAPEGPIAVLRRDGRVVEWSADGVREVPDLEGAAQVVSGHRHHCARRDDGTVACWGSAERGALGDGTWVDFAEPVRVGMTPARGAGR